MELLLKTKSPREAEAGNDIFARVAKGVSYVGRVALRETRRNDPNHAEMVAEMRVPHGGVLSALFFQRAGNAYFCALKALQ